MQQQTRTHGQHRQHGAGGRHGDAFAPTSHAQQNDREDHDRQRFHNDENAAYVLIDLVEPVE